MVCLGAWRTHRRGDDCRDDGVTREAKMPGEVESGDLAQGLGMGLAALLRMMDWEGGRSVRRSWAAIAVRVAISEFEDEMNRDKEGFRAAVNTLRNVTGSLSAEARRVASDALDEVGRFAGTLRRERSALKQEIEFQRTSITALRELASR